MVGKKMMIVAEGMMQMGEILRRRLEPFTALQGYSLELGRWKDSRVHWSPNPARRLRFCMKL